MKKIFTLTYKTFKTKSARLEAVEGQAKFVKTFGNVQKVAGKNT
jgi:hypothetical protein